MSTSIAPQLQLQWSRSEEPRRRQEVLRSEVKLNSKQGYARYRVCMPVTRVFLVGVYPTY